MERQKTTITRRDALSVLLMMGGSWLVGYGLGIHNSPNSDTLTPEQNEFQRLQLLQEEMKKLHNTDSVYLELYPREDKAISILEGKARRISSQNGNVSYVLGDNEMFFARSRFIAPDGSEVKQDPSTIIPNRFSNTVMAKLTDQAPSGDWAISNFEPYSDYNKDNYNDLYSSEEGSINALIPAANLPEKRFVFAFSRRVGTNEWVQQEPSVFDITVDGKKSVFVSLNSHNPNSVPSNFSFTSPTNDKLVFFVTDENGKVVEKGQKTNCTGLQIYKMEFPLARCYNLL